MDRFRCEDFPWCRTRGPCAKPKHSCAKPCAKPKHETKRGRSRRRRRGRQKSQQVSTTISGCEGDMGVVGRDVGQTGDAMTTTRESAKLSATHWVWWVFSMLVIPLLRNHFYVTEREGSLHKVRMCVVIVRVSVSVHENLPPFCSLNSFPIIGKIPHLPSPAVVLLSQVPVGESAPVRARSDHAVSAAVSPRRYAVAAVLGWVR